MIAIRRQRLWLLQALSLFLAFSILKLLLSTPVSFRRSSLTILPDRWGQSSTAQWQAIPSNLSLSQLSDDEGDYNQVLAYQQYRSAGTSDISLSLYYVVNTAADMIPLLTRAGVDISADDFEFQDQVSAQGTYRLFESQGTVHLVSCLNPRGSATVSMTAFAQNRWAYDLQWQRLMPWLLGRTPLVDNRCLWVHLSMPAQQRTPQTDKALLIYWRSVSQWWQPRFPEP